MLAPVVVSAGALSLALGCSAENAVEAGMGAGGPNGAAGAAGSMASPGVTCAVDNQTQACFCEDQGGQAPGRQVCDISVGWQRCECDLLPETLIEPGSSHAVVDNPLNRGPARFQWHRTLPVGGSCEPGHYEGSFDGFYLSAATWGWGTIPVAGNVSFDLGESADGETYTVSNGRMQGIALGMFPFEGDIVGSLDCSMLFFDGYMKNCQYIVGVIPYKFEGPLRSKYQKQNRAFISGLWSVTEPAADGAYPPAPDIQPGNPPPSPWPAGMCGGTGNWSAVWKP